jgi:hypothetical protein
MGSAISLATFEQEDKAVRELLIRIEESWWELGFRLKNILDRKLYRVKYPLFDEYLRDLGLERTKAYRLIDICGFYESLRKLQRCNIDIRGIPWTRLAVLQPHIKHISDPQKIEEWLEKAQRLSVRKLSQELKRRRRGDSASEAPKELTVLQQLLRELPANVTLKRYRAKGGVGSQVEILLALHIPEREPDQLPKLLKSLGILLEERLSQWEGR